MQPIKSTQELLREARASSKTAVTCMHPGFLYNCLQDLRSVVIVEVRSEENYAKMHVRDGVRVERGGAVGSLPVGERVVFLDEDSEVLEGSAVEALAQAARSSYKKVHFLKGGFAAFCTQYPFLCVSTDCPAEVYLRARARYPTEVLSHLLFLGGVVHLSNLQQLRHLGIRTVVDCGCGVTSQLPLTEVHLTFNPEDVDFEAAIQAIEASEKPVFLYDLNGEDLAAAISAAYFSHVKGLKSEHALAYLISKRPDISLRPDLFLQLQNFRKTPNPESLSSVLTRLTRPS